MKVIRAGGDKSHRESRTGADCSGVDLATSRVLTLVNTSLSKNELISVGGMIQTPSTDYTVSHGSSGTTVTFLGIIQDVQKIEVLYFTSE